MREEKKCKRHVLSLGGYFDHMLSAEVRFCVRCGEKLFRSAAARDDGGAFWDTKETT